MLRRTLALIVLATAAIGFGGATATAEAAPSRLIILHTNDTHSHLSPYDKKDLKSIGGIARRATIIKKEQAQQAGRVLVLDGGDCFQGTPIFNFFHGEAEFAAMDAAGYDAVTVGNHDLDDGLLNLQRVYKGRKFKLINTNLVDDQTGKPLFVPSWLVERSGLKVGVFGILGEGSAWHAIAAAQRKGLKVLPAVPVAQKAVADLKARGADFIVMMSHSGLEEDKRLAAEVPGIHVIVGGHSHTKVDAPIAVKSGDWTTLVLQAYQWGEYLGRLELEVDGGKIVSSNGYLVPIAGDTPEDAGVAKIVEGYESQIRDRMAKVIGQAPRGLSVDGKYDRDCELGNWATDLLRARTNADVAILNSGGLRAPINPGPVRVADVFTVFPFENRIVRVDMTGAQLKQVLDMVASKRVSMLQVSGLSFRIDGGQIADLSVGGGPLDPGKTYRITTIDYIAQGNDKYTPFTEAKGYEDMGVLLRDFVLDGIKGNPTLEPPADRRIQLGSR
ncbi:MAG: bifunctional metallophosphatase/5'-nucleotidase [Candidatus Sericytochromatia bacterium]|nr:bifunctional metallophosphatase/5'-nucleotidase [Candidatus Tanganyikabacteria bacterium]